MIVKPKVRGFICTTAHPVGCAKNVEEQIEYIKSKPKITNGPKKVLVIGSSTGYGLASRIAAAFGSDAATVGVFFEKQSEGKRTASAGWYNSVAFEQKAKAAGLYAKNFNGDAFSDEMKQEVIETIKNDMGKIDLVVYSLAAPRRVDPKTGKISKSALKPLGGSYTNKTIDFAKNEVFTLTVDRATQEEVMQTVNVMGGEDWELWIKALAENDLLADNFKTVAYSYVGPEVTTALYRNGTIGAAKDHLEETAKKLDEYLVAKKGRAFVSVNKALVTQSSAAIPFIPLYFIILLKVMKAKGIHEDCIHQIYRLYAQRLYVEDDMPIDERGRIRIDDWEMRDDVQKEVMEVWKNISSDNIEQLTDIKGYSDDFMKLFGFGFDGVDYDADVQI